MINTAYRIEHLAGNWRQAGYELKEVGNKAVLYFKDCEIATFNLSDMLYKNGAGLVVQDACQRHWDNMIKEFKV
jgi:hypothetical protein